MERNDDLAPRPKGANTKHRVGLAIGAVAATGAIAAGLTHVGNLQRQHVAKAIAHEVTSSTPPPTAEQPLPETMSPDSGAEDLKDVMGTTVTNYAQTVLQLGKNSTPSSHPQADGTTEVNFGQDVGESYSYGFNVTGVANPQNSINIDPATVSQLSVIELHDGAPVVVMAFTKEKDEWQLDVSLSAADGNATDYQYTTNPADAAAGGIGLVTDDVLNGVLPELNNIMNNAAEGVPTLDITLPTLTPMDPQNNGPAAPLTSSGLPA